MKKHSKSDAGTKMARTRKQNEVSPIELHLKRGAEIDRLHHDIERNESKIAALLHRRERLLAEL